MYNYWALTTCVTEMVLNALSCFVCLREIPGSIPSQGPRHTKNVIKMVPVVPLFRTEHSKGKIMALSQKN